MLKLKYNYLKKEKKERKKADTIFYRVNELCLHRQMCISQSRIFLQKGTIKANSLRSKEIAMERF
jgi:hypothetical protein